MQFHFHFLFLSIFLLASLLLCGTSVVAQEEEESAALAIIELFDEDNDTCLNEEEFEHLYHSLFPEEEEHDHHHGENDTDHRMVLQRSFTNMAMKLVLSKRGTKSSRSTRFEGKLPKSRRDEHTVQCHPAEEIFHENDLDDNQLLNETEVASASAELLLMVLGGCGEHHDEHASHSECTKPEEWEAWVCALSATLILTLITLVGIFFIPCLSRWKRVYSITIMIMISFASGALIGDAIYHLIPQILEIHSHAPGETHDHGHDNEEEDEEDKEYLGVLTLVIVGIVIFFVLESLLYWFLGTQHSHAKEANDSDDEHELDIKNDKEDIEMKGECKSASTDSDSEVESDASESRGKLANSWLKLQKGAKGEVRRLKFVKTYGWLNLLADAFHNFIDGIAIGVAYTTSLSLGLSTTIAVALHEIPQELGDYGILLNAGFGHVLALTFNLVSGALAFLGCIIGVSVGSSATDADKWLLALTAGGFLYIALTNMFHEMMQATRVKNPWGLLDIFLQLMAMLFGFAILVIIAVYEDDIKDC